MKKKNYVWKRKPFRAPSAEIVVEYLKDIKKKRGGITPQLIVVEARKKKSPLHNCFEWNDSKAAVEYRKEQARYILRMLVVKVVDSDIEEEFTYVRAFISPMELEQKNNTSYRTIGEVRSSEQLDSAYKRQLFAELKASKNKLENYKEFTGVIKAIEKVKI